MLEGGTPSKMSTSAHTPPRYFLSYLTMVKLFDTVWAVNNINECCYIFKLWSLPRLFVVVVNSSLSSSPLPLPKLATPSLWHDWSLSSSSSLFCSSRHPHTAVPYAVMRRRQILSVCRPSSSVRGRWNRKPNADVGKGCRWRRVSRSRDGSLNFSLSRWILQIGFCRWGWIVAAIRILYEGNFS